LDLHGRDQLISEDTGTGSGPAAHFLDPIGNAVIEGSTTRKFSGQKLASQTSDPVEHPNEILTV
jgi:hypothetical protein